MSHPSGTTGSAIRPYRAKAAASGETGGSTRCLASLSQPAESEKLRPACRLCGRQARSVTAPYGEDLCTSASFGLRVPLPDVVSMQTRQPNLEGAGEIPLRRLVKEALRMRHSRIVVGEVRQEECLDLLIALNSGLPGMCTLHANSAREAVVKMCTLPLLAGENIGTAFVVPTVAASVDLVVHVATDAAGQRRVREVVALPGRAEDGVVETADVFTTRAGRLVRADGFPPHPERFAAAGYDLTALLRRSSGRRS